MAESKERTEEGTSVQDLNDTAQWVLVGSTSGAADNLIKNFHCLPSAVIKNYIRAAMADIIRIKEQMQADMSTEGMSDEHKTNYLFRGMIQCLLSTLGKAHTPHCIEEECNKCGYFRHNSMNCQNKPMVNGVIATA